MGMASRATALRSDEPGGKPSRVPSSRQRPLSSHGERGDALIAEVVASLETLRELEQRARLLGHEVSSALSATLRDVEQRLDRAELCVAVAGEPGSGKRTFLDALMGDRALGVALRRTQAIVVLRRRDAIDYRARLARNRVEQFSRDVPDRSAELEKPVQAATRAVEAAEARARELLADAERASERERRDRDALGRAFHEFESKQRDAEKDSAELAAAESRAGALGAEVKAIERAVPSSVRVQPSWWAVWLWLWRSLFILIFLARYRRYQEQSGAREAADKQVQRLQWQTTQRAHECRLAEAELEPLGVAADASREAADKAAAAHADAVERLEQQRAALDAARAALETHLSERREQFFARIAALVRGDGGRTLREIEIDFPARLLPEDVAILDLPEFTDAAVQDDARVWSLVRERADGCVLISELDRAVSGATQRFLHKVREVVPHILLVLTKMDRAFVGAVRRGHADPWDEVEKARRIGTRRFAREIGREPAEVFGLAVAARAALDDAGSGLARRFETESQKMFQLLHHERAIILGMRSATAIRSSIAELGDARQVALDVYRERIAALEAQRTPPPEQFKAEALTGAEPRITAAATGATNEAEVAAHDALAVLGAGTRTALGRARGRRGVLQAARRAQAELDTGIGSAWVTAQEALEAGIDERVRVIELDLFADLRERYQLLHEVRRSQSSIPRLEEADARGCEAVVLAPVEAAATRLVRLRLSLAIVGAVVGAIAGALLASFGGALVGVALGALLGLVPSRARLERQASRSLDRALDDAERRIAERVRASRAPVEEAIRDALDRSLERVIVRFARLIAKPLEAEAAAIERERDALESLEQMGEVLGEHDARLSEAIDAAVDASAGLCR